MQAKQSQNVVELLHYTAVSKYVERKLCFRYKNFSFPFIFVSACNAIDSPLQLLSSIQPRYLT